MLGDMGSYEKILRDHGRTVVSCEEFSHIDNFDSRKPMKIGEELMVVLENGERVDCIVSVLQIEPRSINTKSGQRDKTNDIKLCEIHLGKNFNIDTMNVVLTQCCDDDENVNFIHDEPPNQVPCTHIIIWVRDKQGAHPYETYKALNGTDIEAIYDPAALLQWEYIADDESVTVSQFQTAENIEKTKEKLKSLVQSVYKDVENFQNNVPNEDLPDDMDEEDRTLYMQELLDKKTIYEQRLLEYEEKHNTLDARKTILKTMKCSEAFRLGRAILNASNVTPKAFLLWKHRDMIVVYTCSYLTGWTYDVMRPLEATFVNNRYTTQRIIEDGKKFEELRAMYNSVMESRNNWENMERERRASRKRPHDDSVGGLGGLGAPLTSVSKLLLSLNSLNL
jgi:hypothetical protein